MVLQLRIHSEKFDGALRTPRVRSVIQPARSLAVSHAGRANRHYQKQIDDEHNTGVYLPLSSR
jgi:hypothetical protein